MSQRKLGKATKHRVAMLKTLTAQTILNGKIDTTEPRAKELKSIIDSMISLAIKESKNFEMTKVKVSKAKVDDKGKKVNEKVTSKNGNTYYRVVKEVVEVERQKDMPSRLAVRRKFMRMMDKISDNDGKTIDLTDKLFNEIAPKYEGRIGGYTRIVKTGVRKGDNASTAILQLI